MHIWINHIGTTWTFCGEDPTLMFLTQGNFLHCFTKPETTRQGFFELTDIEYDRIKYEISRMYYVEYNITTRRNVMNVDYIEDFANLWCN